MPNLAERAVAMVEIFLATILFFYCAIEFKGAFFPTITPDPYDPKNWEMPGWAFLGVIAAFPVCLSFAVAGYTMLNQAKYCWWYQLLPVVTALGVVYYFSHP